MHQLVQSVRDGTLSIVELPRPMISPTQVLVATAACTISPGTERAAHALAAAGLVGKARQRPDLVRAVLDKARAEGPAAAAQAVGRRLDEAMPLGYSAAGVVVEAGEATTLRPGQRVATAGAGHGDLQVVAGLLAVPVPDGVALDDAAMAALAAVALEGLRLAEVGPGDAVVVVGLGLIGQLAVRLAVAAGCRVAATDPDVWRLGRAEAAGAIALPADDPAAGVHDWSRGRGADAVLVCAAGSGSEPARLGASVARDRGTVVVVGDTGLDVDRRTAYERELTLRVARSYGPGRYDPTYESLGIDHPVGTSRWTAGRNLEAVLDLLAAGRLAVGDLVTHRVPLERAPDAYDVVARGERHLAVQLEVEVPPGDAGATTRVALRPAGPGAGTGGDGLGLLGAGTFVRATLLPALAGAGLGPVVAVASAQGVHARQVAEQAGAAEVVSGLDELLATDAVGTVVVATPHAGHAEEAATALRAGRHVWCEKPLALDLDGLRAVAEAWRAGDRHLAVGFNRRHAPAVATARAAIAGRGPCTITYRVSAGPVPPGHWYRDRRHGGRLLGEVCHMLDTCRALVDDTAVVGVHAAATAGDELVLAGDVVVTVRFADGSLAAVTYGSGGHPSTPKERIEVLGGGRTVVVDDFRSVRVDGRRAGHPPRRDKGHTAALAAFGRACRAGGDEAATTSALVTSALALAAVESLRTGTEQVPPAV